MHFLNNPFHNTATEQLQWKSSAYGFLVLLFFIIGGSLSGSDIFVYRSLTSYFTYSAGVFLLTAYAGSIIIKSGAVDLRFSKPVIFTLAFGFYVLINTFFITIIHSNYFIYLLTSCCFLVATCTILNNTKPKLDLIFQCILIAAILESFICFCQYFKISASLNRYFDVTGSWENPNITAMFMAMAVPSVFNLFERKRKVIRRAATGILLLFIITLLILKCRTALIGAFIGGLVMLNHRYQLTQRLKGRQNRVISIMLVSIFLAVAIPTTSYIYQAKKSSSDGRRLIWKISSAMIPHHLLFGSGYGSFARNYNLYQADYFEKGNGSADEIRNAGYVRMGYNEPLQNVAEGGVIGLILLLAVPLSLLLQPNGSDPRRLSPLSEKVQNHNCRAVAYAGVIVFMLMSVVNFTVQAIPVMCLFVIYGAILSVDPFNSCSDGPEFLVKDPAIFFKRKRLIGKWVVGCFFLITGIAGIYVIILLAIDNRHNKQALELTKKRYYRESLAILSTLSPDLDSYESYWTNYANTLYANRDYHGAIVQFNKAKQLTSNPTIYMKAAQCYQVIGDFRHAEKDLLTAANMQPNHLLPKYALMNLHLSLRDTTQAVKNAQDIVKTTPKIPSKETRFYQYQAGNLLQRLGYTAIVNTSKPVKFISYTH